VPTISTIDARRFRSGREQQRIEVADQLRHTCSNAGFFFVSNHGIPSECIREMFTTLESFFNLPVEEKLSRQVSSVDYRGFLTIGRFKGDDPRHPQISEAFKLYRGPDDSYAEPGPPMPPNLWPAKPAGFEAAILTYWSNVDLLRDLLLEMFALALGLQEDYFRVLFSRSMTNMTLLHYPRTAENPKAYGASPHTDSDVLTILYPDPVGGLFLKTRRGEWTQVSAPVDHVLVNVGDMMEVWTGGRFVSAPHYVLNHTKEERYAFPYFAAPNPEVVVEPLIRPLDGFKYVSLKVGLVKEYSRALACPYS
jgi:isopenicillin N synthase-like dioxygenase